MNIGAIVLIGFLALLFTPFPRLLVAALFGRQIGNAALSRQPDTIHLEPTDPASLRRANRVQAVTAEYLRSGFSDAGTFAIPEMRDVRVQLLVNTAESTYGTIYDHPAVGVWYDVVTRYNDGGSSTFSSARPTGLEPRPNSKVANLPGMEPGVLIQHARSQRPNTGMLPASSNNAVADFEQAYADYMSWLKQRGITTHEVVEVARRKVA